RHTRFDCDWSSDVCSSDLFSITFLAAYDWNITRDDIVRGSAVDQQALATALNQHFLNVTNAASLIQSKADFAAGAGSLKAAFDRSEERRVGKEGSGRRSAT